jgi:hypothetical protein
MGVYKQIDAVMQEAIRDPALRDTVRWYAAHIDQLSPELMRAILTDEDFFQKALTVWDNERFGPKPASEHVALQEPVVRRRELRKPKRSGMCVAGWLLIGVALVTSVALLVVNL